MYNNTSSNENYDDNKLNGFLVVYLTGIIFSFIIGKIMIYFNFEL